MSIRELSQNAASQIVTNPHMDENQISNIIETAMLNLMKEVETSHKSAVNLCCSADQDMAHKLQEEFKKGQQNLIANLSSMR